MHKALPILLAILLLCTGCERRAAQAGAGRPEEAVRSAAASSAEEEPEASEAPEPSRPQAYLDLHAIALEQATAWLAGRTTAEDPAERITSYLILGVTPLAGDAEEFCAELQYQYDQEGEHPGRGRPHDNGDGTRTFQGCIIQLRIKQTADGYEIVEAGDDLLEGLAEIAG